jgi:hypothetical protein
MSLTILSDNPRLPDEPMMTLITGQPNAAATVDQCELSRPHHRGIESKIRPARAHRDCDQTEYIVITSRRSLWTLICEGRHGHGAGAPDAAVAD